MNFNGSDEQIYDENGVDLTLIHRRLGMTPTERLQEHFRFMAVVEALRNAKKIEPINDPIRRNSKNSHTKSR